MARSPQGQVVAEQESLVSTSGRRRRRAWRRSTVPRIHSNGNGGRQIEEMGKSIGELFVKSKAFTEYQPGSHGWTGRNVRRRPALRRSSQTSAGWAPESLRTGHVEYFPTRPAPAVVDLFPEYPTKQAAVKYMEETTFTNNAAEAAEGGSLQPGDARPDASGRRPIRKVTVWLPVTDEQLEDESEAAYVHQPPAVHAPA
jgi:hypothetical protein